MLRFIATEPSRDSVDAASESTLSLRRAVGRPPGGLDGALLDDDSAGDAGIGALASSGGGERRFSVVGLYATAIAVLNSVQDGESRTLVAVPTLSESEVQLTGRG